MLTTHNASGDKVELVPRNSSSERAWDGVVVDEFDVSGGSEVSLPAQDQHLIAMVVKGATHCSQRRDGKHHRSIVRPGTVMIVPAGVTSYFNCSKSHRSSTTKVPSAMLSAAAEELGIALHGGAVVQPCFDSRDSLIADVVSILLEELRRPAHPGQSLIVSACSHALAAHLLRTLDVESMVPAKTPSRLTSRQLTAVVEYMEHHIDGPVELADIAGVANVSRYHFTRMFKASTGISPMAYLQRSRIERAQMLIRAGKLRLSEVALAVGFADQSHFTARFLRHTGVTPGSYSLQCAVDGRGDRKRLCGGLPEQKEKHGAG